MTNEALQQATEQAAQSEWDAVAKERETGEPAAAVPQAKPVEAVPAVDPIQERLDKLEARTRNAEGHIGGLNHNQRLLQESLQAASRAAMQRVSSAPTQAQVKEAMQDPAEWAGLKAGYPEWAAATEKLMDARLSRVRGAAVDPDAIARIVKEQVAGQSVAVRSEIINSSLDAVYPDWQADVKSDRFGRWMNGQPPEVRALAHSASVKDAAKMLALFERAKADNPTADIVAARNKKLANAASAPRGVRSPAVKSFEDMTDKEKWDYEANRRERAKTHR